MPILTSLITLSDTTATKIVGNHHMPHKVILHNMTKSSNQFIHIGNADVTDTNSMHIDPGETLHLTLGPGDELWAVSDPDGLQVGVTDIRQAG